MLTFIAEYPSEANIRDGMMIRIKEIDNKYKNFDRIYLDISFFRPRKNFGKPIVMSEYLTVYHLNFFKDFFKIYSLLSKSQNIYVQALYNYVKILIYLHCFLPNKRVALDLHGAIPEELAYNKSKNQSQFYNLIEKFAFKRVNHFIHVTRTMQKHFIGKYPLAFRQKNMKEYVLGIFTTYNSQMNENLLEQIKVRIKWEENQIWFVYSGGVQDWQNIPLMIQIVKGLKNPNYRFLFLSGSPEVIEVLVRKESLTERILVKSVDPNELKEYYSLAHYGFVLRNKNIVNQVSNPTKLSEYLAYGIIPIVLEASIGDYLEMGYEYIGLGQLSESLNPKKSTKNQIVYQDYINSMQKVELPFFN